MGHSDLDPAVHERRPWNAGQNVGQKRPLKLRDIWAIRFYLDEHKRLRDRALFDLGIDSKLRGCDLVKLRIGDLMSAGSFRDRATIIQKKTGRPVQFEIMAEARNSLTAWLDRRGGTIRDFVFPSRVDYLGHLSTRQYARLVDEWVATVGLDKREYGTHSMRRTKPSLIYKATGNLRAVQILLGHTNIENTVRYLGVDVEDALTLSERTEI
ncbi:tyrosine-type recombinase/integrase [Allopontixanthobacter sediminis]|uniref:Tyrosine-type recombinase/integrase n=1 Tax=Allopontixanthobacter sediminis TaxID=1689985 RepID=A0A845B4B7_9SPHN|nr:tyrosine-type recombinase/integrase [Allopontixanthobacter sediminis]MXP44984.1 tyrosine-type recombinase/integrase [Allopontixanthobacter sediminis]